MCVDVFGDPGRWTEEDLIRWVTDQQNKHIGERGLEFRSLSGTTASAHRRANLFPEVDKYARLAHPRMSRQPGGQDSIKLN